MPLKHLTRTSRIASQMAADAGVNHVTIVIRHRSWWRSLLASLSSHASLSSLYSCEA
jgi:hypothetical protein